MGFISKRGYYDAFKNNKIQLEKYFSDYKYWLAIII
jgi:hypothetical protein